MVRSPSKFLSIKFLQGLQLNNYLSEAGKEYCQSEVDDLLIEKLASQAERGDREYNNELARRAFEAQATDGGCPPPLPEMKEVEMPEKNNVLSIVPQLEKNTRTTCVECGHKVETEDDWQLGCDLPVSKSDPLGTQDSGMYVCPACDVVQDHSILDGMVLLDAEGNLRVNIPKFMVDELMDCEFNIKGARLNFGQAIVNAVRVEFMKRYGEDAIDTLYPADKDFLLAKLEAM